MTRRQMWRAGFLAVTGLAVGMELWAVLDGEPDTEPLTHIVVEHVPAEVTLLAVGALSGWLAEHFRLAYKKKRKRG